MGNNYFVFTSNVDNHFKFAGFDETKILECHGSIFHFQCPCLWEIYEADVDQIEIDTENFVAKTIPTCPNSCNDAVRPNILMFGDWDWLPERTE